MNLHAARQPILDRSKKLFAYELLFRDSIDRTFANLVQQQCTSDETISRQLDFSLNDFTGGKPAFINFTSHSLKLKYPSMLASQQVVVELSKSARPCKQLLVQIKELKAAGHTIVIENPQALSVWRHFYPYIDIIKIDFISHDGGSVEKIISTAKRFPKIQFLADKIESHDSFEAALNLDFSYFQGYFFSKPERVKSKTLSVSQAALAQLLYETSKVELDLEQIINVFQLDLNLSYKLLRYSNSAAFNTVAEISSIRQAIVHIGATELHQLVAILFSTDACDNKPTELMTMSLSRAKFAEQLSIVQGNITLSSTAFLTGMLSLIDVILEDSMQSILSQLPLTPEIAEALISSTGELAQIIDVIKYYENSDWDNVGVALGQLNIDAEQLPAIYLTSVKWASEQIKAL